MGASILDRFSSWGETYRGLLHASPLACGSYLAAMGLIPVLAALLIRRGQSRYAYWSAVAIVLVNLSFFFGEDLGHHVYRTIVLAEQLRQGRLNLLLIDPTSGEALPTFVYYSFVPYLPGAALNLAGLPAHAAVKIVLAGAFLVMASGLQRLVEHAADRGLGREKGYLIAILFVCANYVYGLWLTRMALAEIWVYCLVPWVSFQLLKEKATLPLTALLFLQTVTHPIVFAQALAASFLVACGLAQVHPVILLRRLVPPAVVATTAGAPFWLPQLLWKRYILGTAGLPASLSGSFLTLVQLFAPRFTRNVGLFLPLAVLALIATARARLSWRAWIPTLAFAAGMVMQTQWVRPVTMHVPLLSYSLFIWRLMLPVAFLGFGALLAGWRQVRVVSWLLPMLGLFSVLATIAALLGPAQTNLSRIVRPAGDRSWYRDYTEHPVIWGRGEFLPNYASLAVACGHVADSLRIPFADLVAGVEATKPYIAVPEAPLGFVTYTMGSDSLRPAACGTDLILGPLRPGAVVTASDAKLATLLQLRIASLLIVLAGLAAVAGRRRIAAFRRTA